MREEQPIVAHVAIQQDPTVREELGVNRDVIGGVRYVMIETRHFKVLLPIDSAKPLILAAFPSFDDARVESMLTPLRNRAPVLTEPTP